jgi:hypothetical protein
MPINAPDIFVHHKVVGSSERQAPGVVSSVLERFQRGENCRADVALLAYVAENAAHSIPSLAGTPAKCIPNRRPNPSGSAVFNAEKRGNVVTGIDPHAVRILSADHPAGLGRT